MILKFCLKKKKMGNDSPTEIIFAASTQENGNESIKEIAGKIINRKRTSIAYENNDLKKSKNTITLNQYVGAIIYLINNLNVDTKIQLPSLSNVMNVFLNFNKSEIAKSEIINQDRITNEIYTQMENNTKENIIETSMIALNNAIIVSNLDKSFSFECFKFFLINYWKNLSVEDFVIKSNSNSKIVNGDSRKKSKIANITKDFLTEYSRDLNNLKNNIHKFNEEEIDAIKIIMNNNLHLNRNYYNFIFDVKPITSYICSEKILEEYVKIPISYNNRLFIIITKNVIIKYNNNSLSIGYNWEKECKCLKKDDANEFIVLDAAIQNGKITIIDFIQASHTELPILYEERLEWIRREYNYDCVSLSNLQDLPGKYIQKARNGLNKVSYYYDTPLIGAIVGMHHESLLIAYHNNMEGLEMKQSIDNNSIVNFHCLSAEFDYVCKNNDECSEDESNKNSQNSETNEINEKKKNQNQNMIASHPKQYDILLYNKTIKVNIAYVNFKLFKKVIPVVIKNGKIQQISANDKISHMNDFKETLSKCDKNDKEKLRTLLSNYDPRYCDLEMISMMKRIVNAHETQNLIPVLD